MERVTRAATIADDIITLRPMAPSELEAAHAMSADAENRPFLVVDAIEKFRADHSRPDLVYLAIDPTLPPPAERGLIGYLILVLEPDGRSVECRRIVVARKGRGYGKRAMTLLERYCREVLGRERIWLDVYDFNDRGRHVYESLGYGYMDREERAGKTLLFYEKTL